MRYETQPYEKIILCKFILNVFRRRKPALCGLTNIISFYYIKNKYDKSKLETEEQVDDYFTCIYTIINKHL